MPTRSARAAALALAAALVAGSCAGGDGEGTRLARDGTATTAAPTTTTTTTEATTTTTAPPAPPPPGAAPSCPEIPAQALPDPRRPRYVMDVRLLLEENAVEGQLTVRFTPDLATDRLVFRLWPNGPRSAEAGARLDVGALSLGSSSTAPATESPDPTTLVVLLGETLEPGRSVEATVPWRLTLPGPVADRVARHGDAVRLGSFFPILAWQPGEGWAMEPATAAFAEASTAPVADFDYSVTVPEGLSVLASGTPGAGRGRATAMRDVAISIGRFRLVEGEARAPGPVHVTVGVHEGMDDDPAAYLERSIRALEDFAGRFGPYPYPTHTLALTPGLPGGIEYPGHVMQGPGTIGRTTSHEVGHMWFYSVVGNNQGRSPWLDEGLASWAEARFEGSLDSFRDKIIPTTGRGKVGQPMTFWESRQPAYYRSVYVQGAVALAALGDPDMVDCGLRLYVAANAFRLARPVDVLLAMRQVFPDAEATLARFGAFP